KQSTRDSVDVRSGRSNAKQTSYSTSRIVQPGRWYHGATDSARIVPSDTIRVSILVADEFAADAQILKATVHAIRDVFGVTLVETLPTKTDWIFWLRKDEPSRPLTSKTIL